MNFQNVRDGAEQFQEKMVTIAHSYGLTRSMQEVTVERESHERVRKLSEPTFHQACDGVNGVVLQIGRLGI